MHVVSKLLIGALLAGGCDVYLSLQPGAFAAADPTTQLVNSSAHPPVANVSLPVDTLQLIKKLGSDNEQERNSAQKQLVDQGDSAKPALKDAAENSDDLEVRSRAAVILSLLNNRTVSQGSLITLHAKQMSPQEVFKAISDQAHSQIDAIGMAVSTAAKPGRTVTLDADQKPFWEVMADICTQLNVCPSLNFNGQNAMRLMPAWENWMAHEPHEMVGPYWIGVSSLTHSRTASFNGSSPLREEFFGQLIFLPEPRLTVTQISDFKVIEATDDAGHSLMPRPLPMGIPASPMRKVAWSIPMLQFNLTYPEQPGSKISLLRGEVLVMLAEDYQQYQMDDVLGTPKVTNPLDGADMQVHVSQHDGEIRVDMQCARGTLDTDKWSAFENCMSNLTVEDADGHPFMLTHPPSMTMSSQSASISTFKAYATFSSNVPGAVNQPSTARVREPQRLVWRFPTSFKEVKIPVTFKDLPMP